MKLKKEFIFEIFIIALIFILVPFFYNNINAFFFTDSSLYEKTADITMTGLTVTAYCPGPCCNGKWAGMTATGKTMKHYIEKDINIIAVDPELIELGSKIIYNGKEYTAVDTGKSIKGKRLDILFPTHEETEIFGIKRNQKIKIIK
ncbi:MAG: 3D domain-containing protein [Spirochaetes bacterium]|nr:3D domain-containing protein [Spirochaetota bacterium]